VLNSISVGIFGIFLSGLALALYSSIFDEFSNWLLTLLFLICLTMALQNICTAVYRVSQRHREYLLTIILPKLVSALIIFLLATSAKQISLQDLLLAILIPSALISIFNVFSIFQIDVFSNLMAKFEKNEVKKAIFFCFPVMCSNCIFLFTPVFERTLIYSSYDHRFLSLYAFNYDLILKFLAVIILSLKVVFYPKIMQSVNPTKSFKRLVRLAAIVGMFFVPIFIIPGELAYKWLLNDMLDLGKYHDSTLFILLCAYVCLVSCAYIASIGVMVSGKTKLLLISSLTFLLVHVSILGGIKFFRLDYIFIPLSLVIAQSSAFIVLAIFVWRTLYVKSPPSKV